MRLKLFLISLLILVALPAHAWMGPVISGGGVAAVGEWNYSAGSDSYSTDSVTNQNEYGSLISFTGTKTATKIGVKIADAGSATECGLALYKQKTVVQFDLVTSPTHVHFAPSAGWNDVTIPSTSVSDSDTYLVMVMCDQTFTIAIKSVEGTGNLKYKGFLEYANFPVNWVDVESNNNAIAGVRMFLE